MDRAVLENFLRSCEINSMLVLTNGSINIEVHINGSEFFIYNVERIVITGKNNTGKLSFRFISSDSISEVTDSYDVLFFK